MTTLSELVDQGDISEERKDNVKKVLRDLGYGPNRAVGKAVLKISEKHMTEAGMSVADANAILECTYSDYQLSETNVKSHDAKMYFMQNNWQDLLSYIEFCEHPLT